MTPQDFKKILYKYSKRIASSQERDIVDLFYTRIQQKNKKLSIPFNADRKKRIKSSIDLALWPQNKHFNFQSKAYAIAAVLLVLVSLGTLISGVFNDNLTTVSTARGEHRQIAMVDGSQIFLNAKSSITYTDDFLNQRHIKLSGEAFFKVAHNPKKPFKVNVGDVETSVLGTSFNIKATQGKEITVSVNTGKVAVVSKMEPKNKLLLIKNQQVVFKKDEKPIISQAESENLMAWSHNIIFLDETSLAETAKTLEDWYDVDIELKDESIKNLKLSGKFKEEKLTTILKSIALVKNLKIIYKTPKNILIRKKIKQ